MSHYNLTDVELGKEYRRGTNFGCLAGLILGILLGAFRYVDVDVKLYIGSVTFAKRGLDFRKAPMGNERIELLRKFYRGEGLGGETAVSASFPTQEIIRDEVDWETAGPRVTVDRCGNLERTPNGSRCVKLAGHTGPHSLWPGEAWRNY